MKIFSFQKSFWGLILTFLFFLISAFNINAQVSTVGGFEGTLPSYWHKGNTPNGATLTWATDQFRSMGKSLKITKGVTTAAAVWESNNMADFWSPQHLKDVDIKVGAWVRTEGVNTNPATEDEKWKISYTFYDSAGAMIGTTMMDIDQSTASNGAFYADTNAVGATILPKNSWKTIIKFIGGKNATGTVWADDFMLYGRGAWAGQDWNTAVGVPSGWIYWLPPNGGNDGKINKGFENTVVTTEEAHSGLNSLKFDLPLDRVTGDAFVGTRRMLFQDMNVNPGDYIRISVWLKAKNLQPDSAALYPTTYAVGFTYGFWSGVGNNDGWNSVGGNPVDMQFALPAVKSFNWKQYYIDVKVPNDPTAIAMSVRLHAYSRFTGTVYWDDLKVEKIDVPDLNAAGGFEGALPSYWKKGSTPNGATLTWATDQSRSMGKSLKITKGVTSDAAVWESKNMADFWSPQHLKDVDIKLGAWVKTDGVNTNPATDDEKWKISYSFYDSAGTLIGTTVMDIDQSTASSGAFYADTNAVGATILPKNSWKTIIKFIGGKNATGTVWADDFMLFGRGAWAGQDWNAAVGVPTGWIYWLPPNGGNDG
ncbi:MAG TPA: hypothetical protein ENI57_03025, partial [Ignavibacteria bacterium]|nr:hypothetical protein [Ignavibacteria bacterium]